MLVPRPDKCPDLQNLAKAANILDASEFDVLRIANVKWHGEEKEGDYERIEKMFGEFITNKTELPLWARDFCRKVVRAWNEKDEEELRKLFTI